MFWLLISVICVLFVLIILISVYSFKIRKCAKNNECNARNCPFYISGIMFLIFLFVLFWFIFSLRMYNNMNDFYQGKHAELRNHYSKETCKGQNMPTKKIDEDRWGHIDRVRTSYEMQFNDLIVVFGSAFVFIAVIIPLINHFISQFYIKKHIKESEDEFQGIYKNDKKKLVRKQKNLIKDFKKFKKGENEKLNKSMHKIAKEEIKKAK